MSEKSIKIGNTQHFQISHIKLFLEKKFPHHTFSRKKVMELAIGAYIKKLNELYNTNQEQD